MFLRRNAEDFKLFNDSKTLTFKDSLHLVKFYAFILNKCSHDTQSKLKGFAESYIK